MQHSEQLNELAAALAAAQGAFKAVSKDAINPHLKNKYATLDAIIGATRPALSANGLALVQAPEHGGAEGKEVLTTMLLHESGQWLSTAVSIDVPEIHKGINDLQAFGSSLTYMKRYAMAAMLGVATDQDDDGESGSRAAAPPKKAKQQPVTDPWKQLGVWIKGQGRDGDEAKAILKETHGKTLLLEDIPKFRQTLTAYYAANPLPDPEDLPGGEVVVEVVVINDDTPPDIPF